MLNLNRRNALLTAACAGAAFGLPKPVSFIEAALAQKGPEAGKGFRPFKFGKVQGFILNDGVWEKPHALASSVFAIGRTTKPDVLAFRICRVRLSVCRP